MLKRLIQVAFLTGAAHIFTLFSLKYISIHTTAINLKAVGEIDSLSNFIITIIALGLLMATVRDIAISENWKLEFESAQRARVTLSLFLVPFGFFSFYESNYFIFFFAPVFALNGDYALYGRSFPVTASALAFFRVLLPGMTLIFASFYYPNNIIPCFITSIIFSHILTGYLVVKMLKLPYFLLPHYKALTKYLQTFRLGLVSLSFYFLGLGLIWVAAFFYTDVVVAKAYLGIKLYVIFKGVLRIINQSFVKEISRDDVSLKVDQLAFIASNSFLVGAIIFPNSFTMLFLGTQFIRETESLILLVASGLICASFTSFTTKAMLEKKDRVYSKWATISIICSIILLILLSMAVQSINSIFSSLLIGELIFAIGLILIIDKYEIVKTRVKSMMVFSLYLIIPVLIRLVLGDTFFSLFTGFAAYGSILLLTQYKKFGLNLNVANAKN
jgi:hypothetical protein